MQKKILPMSYRLILVLYNAIYSLIATFLFIFNYFRSKKNNPALPVLNNGYKVDMWVLCPSSGDEALLKEILSSWPEEEPITVLASTGTQKGYEFLKNLHPPRQVGLLVDHMPQDRSSVVKSYLKKFSPRALIQLGTIEFRPNLFLNCKKQDIPSLFLNPRLSPRSLARYLFLQNFWYFLGPDEICASSEIELSRLRVLFPGRKIDKLPDINLDRYPENNLIPYVHNPLSHYLKAQSQFLVFALVGKEEEDHIIRSIKEVLYKRPKSIIAIFPEDNAKSDTWDQLLQNKGISRIKRSELQDQVPPGSVILWDVAGEIDAAYALARGVFVGGTLAPRKKEADFLRPLYQGVIPCIGPYWHHFAWAEEVVFRQGLVTQVQNEIELQSNLLEYLKGNPKREKINENFHNFLVNGQGGTTSAINKIISYIRHQN